MYKHISAIATLLGLAAMVGTCFTARATEPTATSKGTAADQLQAEIASLRAELEAARSDVRDAQAALSEIRAELSPDEEKDFAEWRRARKELRRTRMALGAEQKRLDERLSNLRRQEELAVAVEAEAQRPQAGRPIALAFQPPVRYADGPPRRQPIYSGSAYSDYGGATPFANYVGLPGGALGGFGGSRIPHVVQPTIFLRRPSPGIQINISPDGGRPTITPIPPPRPAPMPMLPGHD